MAGPSREIGEALAAGMVDLHAGERGWASPDHRAPPNPYGQEVPRISYWIVYAGLFLVAVAVLALLFL